MTHALRPGFLEQQPLWITVLDLLPVSLLALAVSVEGFPKPPISAEGAIAAFVSALGLLGFLLWKRWMGIELAVFSLFPLALLPAFDEITTAYKTPFIFLSTLVIAYCLKRLGRGKVRSLEHDPVYASRTRQLITEHGLGSFAEVIDAPLVEQRADGAMLRWYDCSKAGLAGPIDLLVVDGPPDTTGPQARYPALPLLKHLLAPGSLVVLDDGGRDDERFIAKRWADLVPGAELRYLELEAGAWMLRLPPGR